MKKAIVSIVLLCYLVVTSGVIVNFHFCMNRLASTELFGDARKECGKCGMHLGKSKGCCHDEVKIVKMENDQKVNSVLAFSLPAIAALPQLPSIFMSTSFMNAERRQFPSDHAPPYHLRGEDTYLLNGVFRI